VTLRPIGPARRVDRPCARGIVSTLALAPVAGSGGDRSAPQAENPPSVPVDGRVEAAGQHRIPADGAQAGDYEGVLTYGIGVTWPNPLVVEHVWFCAADSTPATAGVERHVEAAALAEAARLLDDTVALWSDKFPDVEVRRALRHGLDPAFALTAASRSAALLVVGSTVASAPLVQALIHRARCPVAVVPCGQRA
jgi:hypothetical protein